MSRKPNVVELLYSSCNLESAYPGIYCVYSPLALANLEDLIKPFTLNLPAQITLLMDYLRGLVYLHDQKGIMHRDIKPENLGLLSFCPPRGIILDLDAATSEETSNDPNQGTIPYQAPEIINLRLQAGASEDSYGRSVDVWALGMSAFYAFTCTHPQWSILDHATIGLRLPGTDNPDFVLATRLKIYHQAVEILSSQFESHMPYFDLLENMTMYSPQKRFSASEALNEAEGLRQATGEPAMFFKEQAQAHGTKRKIGEV